MIPQENIRNIAIIAHVDHGKTSLVDEMLKQTGAYQTRTEAVERVMDSNEIERERGITILAKNTSVRFRDYKINIVDTPGHADFGGEVERIMKMVDGALLLVDAAEGPMPQTRFVLSKAFQAGLPVIVIINKIDRSDARADEVLNEIYDLFLDLDCTEAQLEFPYIYAIGRQGVSKRTLDEPNGDLTALLETIIQHVPPPTGHRSLPLQILISNLDYDPFVGRLSIGRIENGTINLMQPFKLHGPDGKLTQGRVTKLFAFEGLERTDIEQAGAGEIVSISGIDDVNIGDTISDEKGAALPRIKVDEPTLSMVFTPNASPFGGKEGKYVTGKNLKERLEREVLKNISIRLSQGNGPEQFVVQARGELQMAVLLETMRREGFEVEVSNPVVITHEIEGKLHEPMEKVFIDVPEEYVGVITAKLNLRKGRMINLINHGTGRVRVEFHVPTRGLLGYRGEFLLDTRGTGIMNTLFDRWVPWQGDINFRISGVLVSNSQGKATHYALGSLQERGELFISPQTPVYEGMVVGRNSRQDDLAVNACKEKKLTNMRSSGTDNREILAAPIPLTLEKALAFMTDEELLEVTPTNIRLRKRVFKKQ